MKTKFLLTGAIFAIGLFFVACDDKDEAKPKPSIDGIEVGLSNNEIGVIGRDFHFNAEVLAGDLIDTVRIKIQPRTGETYAADWSFEKKWDSYKGTKNATWHKHFNIPEDAAEGTYDFIIIVEDENGTKIEEVRTIRIYLPENLQVDPFLAVFSLFRRIYDGDKISSVENDPQVINEGDSIISQVTISGVKGDGIMYMMLIKKSLGYLPESVDAIDFSKVIVYDVYEHENEEEIYEFSNFHTEPEPVFTIVRYPPLLGIGAEEDLDVPPNPISGEKAWESGDYYYGVVYENTTYNMSLFNYIELEVSMD